MIQPIAIRRSRAEITEKKILQLISVGSTTGRARLCWGNDIVDRYLFFKKEMISGGVLLKEKTGYNTGHN
jgi:hypothetical protein